MKLVQRAAEGHSIPRMEGDPAFKNLVTSFRERVEVGIASDGRPELSETEVSVG